MTQSAQLAALKKTHDVYRRAREVRDKERQHADALADKTHNTSSPAAARSSAAPNLPNAPSPRSPGSAKLAAEAELAASVKRLRAAQEGQATAGRRAAEEREMLHAALKEARELAARRDELTRAELRQERLRVARAERRRDDNVSKQPEAAAALESTLHEAQTKIDHLESALKAQREEAASLRDALRNNSFDTPPPTPETPYVDSLRVSPPQTPSPAPPAAPGTPQLTPIKSLTRGDVTDEFRTCYPLLAASAVGSDDSGAALCVVGGGGGSSKTGVPNALLLCRLHEAAGSATLELVCEHRTGDDAPLSVSLDAAGARLAAVQGDSLVIYPSLELTDEAVASPRAWDAIRTFDKKAPKPPAALRPPSVVFDAPVVSDKDAPPTEPVPYCVALSGHGTRAAAGMSDGTLVVYEATAAGGWREAFRSKSHSAEVQCLGFSARASELCSTADDGTALLWALDEPASKPREMPLPSFRWQAVVSPTPKKRGKRLPHSAKWRFAHPLRVDANGVTIVGAVNHSSNTGHVLVVSAPVGTAARVTQTTKACNHRISAFAALQDGSLVVVGSSEGELVLLRTSNLQRVSRLQPFDMFVTALCLIDLGPGKVAALACSGDNACKVLSYGSAALAPRRGLLHYMGLLVAVLVALAATVAAHPPMAEWLQGEVEQRLGVNISALLMQVKLDASATLLNVSAALAM